MSGNINLSTDSFRLSPELVYKIMPEADWLMARAAGAFAGSAVDLADGYVHLSAADQVEGTLARHYAGVDRLVIAGFEPKDLGAHDLRWEASRGGDLFPHLYAPLPVGLSRWQAFAHWDGARHSLRAYP